MTNPLSHLEAALDGRYSIERQIGQGGMATVYLARDVKHDRRVAVKVLNPELGAVLGAERFLAEIRVTANLQHPHLLPLFDSGEAGGLLFYVMPYVEGETLRHRIDRERQLPIDDAIAIATAVAGALDYAHKHGVIHRDLKPENILLQHGQPVVADFGIALAVANAGGTRVTQTGLSLGTPQYMSPEQATGDRTIDARSDIYSLGAVTYEMLAGEPPHAGNTAQAIIAKLMTEEPRPLRVLRRLVPEHVDDAVHCALEKLPADRFPTAGAFAQALTGASAPGAHTKYQARAAVRRPTSSRALIAALVATTLGAITFAVLWAHASRSEPELLQFVLDTPGATVVPTNESAVALSPDGRMIAYTSRVEPRPVEIYLRRLDSLSARADHVPGIAPLFTPDGKWLLYQDNGAVRRVPVGGGNSEVVAALPNGWQGYAVSPRGDIAVSMAGSIWHVGDGGKLIRVLSPDTKKGEASYPDPIFLDDKTIAFWLQRSDGDKANGVGITTLDGGEHSVLNIAGSKPFGMLDGHLLIGTEDGRLLAYPLSVRRRRITGPPVVLLDSAVWIITGGLQISLARDGTLAYLRGRSHRSLVIVDRRGDLLTEAPDQMEFTRAAFSPDGKRVAVTVRRSTIGGANVIKSDLWMWDVEGKSLVKFADGASAAAWSSDGKRIAFLQNASPRRDRLVWAASDGSGQPELLTEGPTPQSTITDVSYGPGDRELLIVVRDTASRSGGDIYSLDLRNPQHPLTPVAVTKYSETAPAVSPDGRWLAYVSNETGRDEIYVRPYGSAAGRVRITRNGGSNPQWLAGGSRLLYSEPGRRLIAEVSQAGGSLTAVVRDSVSVEGTREGADRTGERILVVRDPPERRVVIVKNWVIEARRKLGGR